MKVPAIPKWVVIIFSVFVLIIIYWTQCHIEVPHSYDHLLSYYKNYYITARYVPNNMPAPFGSDKTIIYMLPGQKWILLNKMKKDINNVLNMIVEKYGYIYYKYEISGDMSRIRIYEAATDVRNQKYYDYLSDQIRIELIDRYDLYNTIKHGYSWSYEMDGGIKFIEYKPRD